MQSITFFLYSGSKSLSTSSILSEYLIKSSSLVSWRSPTSQVMWQSLIFWFFISYVWNATRRGCSIFSQRPPLVSWSPQIQLFSLRASMTVRQQRRQKRLCFLSSSKSERRSRLIRLDRYNIIAQYNHIYKYSARSKRAQFEFTILRWRRWSFWLSYQGGRWACLLLSCTLCLMTVGSASGLRLILLKGKP